MLIYLLKNLYDNLCVDTGSSMEFDFAGANDARQVVKIIHSFMHKFIHIHTYIYILYRYIDANKIILST